MNSTNFILTFIPVISAILVGINFLFAPYAPYKEKKTPFECGYHSFLLQNRTQFTIVFFIFALLFLLFDLEIVLIYPFTVSTVANAIYGLIIVILFALIVTVGFVYELGKNALKIESRQSNLDSQQKVQVKLGLPSQRQKDQHEILEPKLSSLFSASSLYIYKSSNKSRHFTSPNRPRSATMLLHSSYKLGTRSISSEALGEILDTISTLVENVGPENIKQTLLEAMEQTENSAQTKLGSLNQSTEQMQDKAEEFAGQVRTSTSTSGQEQSSSDNSASETPLQEKAQELRELREYTADTVEKIEYDIHKINLIEKELIRQKEAMSGYSGLRPILAPKINEHAYDLLSELNPHIHETNENFESVEAATGEQFDKIDPVKLESDLADMDSSEEESTS